METIIFTTLGLIIGGLVTFYTTKHFFRKGIKSKSLSTYIQFITEILSDIDPEVEKKLKVSYDDEEVDKLYQIQYVIANTGDIPIRDLIEPLTLIIPNHGELLDVNIIYIEPEGRKVNYKIGITNNGEHFVSFNFPLLNSSEYFIAKLLIKGEPPDIDEDSNQEDENLHSVYSDYKIYKEFEFTITVDDLPPKLISKPLPFDYEYSPRSKKIEWSALFTAFGVGIFSFFLSYVLTYLEDFNSSLDIFQPGQFFTEITLLSISVLLLWILNLILVFIIVLLIIVSFSDIKPQKKPKFQLPQKHSNRSHYPFEYYIK